MNKWVFLSAAIVVSINVPRVVDAGYVFTKIADSRAFVDASAGTGVGAEPFLGAVDVNNAGQVSFIASWDEGRDKVYRAGTGGLALIADDAVENFGEMFGTSMNDAGQVAFEAILDLPERTEYAIFRGSGGPLTTIASSVNQFDTFAAIPSINNAGDVSFMGYLDNFAGGLFVGNGGPVRTILDTDNSAFDNAYGQSSINAAGHVAFEASRRDGPNGIHLYRDNAIITLLEEGDMFSAVSDPVMNQRSGVAFRAVNGDGTEVSIYTTYGGALTEIADTTGRFIDFYHHDFNDRDQVVFEAAFMDGESFLGGIFIGPDFDRDRVIRIGDSLDGSVVVDVGLGGINDAGQLAFWADLEDGRSVVMLAEAVVPEPQGIVLVVSLAAVVVRGRRSHDRQRGRR